MFVRFSTFGLVALVAISVLALAGCGGSDGENTSGTGLPMWLGGESYFEAQIEGTLPDSIAGTAEYRLDAEGRLTGLELNRGEKFGDGLSIELEPHPPETRTYSVVNPSLLDAARSDDDPGATAFLVDGTQRFTAVRGTVEVTEVGWTGLYGTFDLQMDGTMDEAVNEQVGIQLTGTFQATEEEQ